MRHATVLATVLMVALSGATVLVPKEAVALPTPGLNCQHQGTPLSGLLRYIPEPQETNDYVGYFEAKQCFEALNRAFPDRMELKSVGKSYGLMNRQTSQRDSFDVYIAEVTNEKSAIPFEDKVKVVLMLSIHGNEKGGREGGFRLMEDFVRNMGVARQPAPGFGGKTLFDLMDYAAFILLFPNPDGWAWDEPQYVDPAGCTYPGMYKRVNGRCTDLNRQLPTTGWQRISQADGRLPMRESEPTAYANVLRNYTNVAYAADIHGMLNPADGCAYGICGFTSDAAPTGESVYGHFVLGLVSAGQVDPREMLRSTRLANLLKTRLNSNPTFAAWHTAPSTSLWGGEYYSWSTVWDTIGYTDSGISGDWFLQDTGLNAPGMNFEMAYNHITFDSAYPGAAQAMNVYHVETVREIGRAYLESAVADVQTSIEVHGKKSAYLYNPKIVASGDDRPLDGWALTNPNDDPWDYSHVAYDAVPNEFFRDMVPYMKDGERPAVFDELGLGELKADTLAHYDNLIVAGSAVDAILADSAAHAVLEAFVEAGGNLVLTDESMTLLERVALVPAGSVNSFQKYAGMTLL
ncbi:MAG TPA: M14 family zinc carboxypeptidase, partial [Candidatus Thermoplasmatota archaeon]|nr:M14 family zinc carboxypeptidase [Candidatus Thermoplasmatota archaeon]